MLAIVFVASESKGREKQYREKSLKCLNILGLHMLLRGFVNVRNLKKKMLKLMHVGYMYLFYQVTVQN